MACPGPAPSHFLLAAPLRPASHALSSLPSPCLCLCVCLCARVHPQPNCLQAVAPLGRRHLSLHTCHLSRARTPAGHGVPWLSASVSGVRTLFLFLGCSGSVWALSDAVPLVGLNVRSAVPLLCESAAAQVMQTCGLDLKPYLTADQESFCLADPSQPSPTTTASHNQCASASGRGRRGRVAASSGPLVPRPRRWAAGLVRKGLHARGGGAHAAQHSPRFGAAVSICLSQAMPSSQGCTVCGQHPP